MLSLGTVIEVPGKVRKPKTAYEHIMAEDDGLIHDGQNYVVNEVVPSEHADLCDLYKCEPTGLLKLARHASDNDLVENEARVLKHLVPAKAPNDKFYLYLPRLLHEVKHDGCAGNIIPYFEGHLSLAEILKACPVFGIDFRDMVWMYKRMLVGIGFAHTQGVVHGAILPPHVLVHPTDHGAKIVDWSCAITDPKERIKAAFSNYEDFYPPEILRKQPVTPTADIFMATKCAVALLGGDVKTNRLPNTVPNEIKDFFEPCLNEVPHYRPADAWDLHEKFDGLLLRVVGKPKYRPFKLPEAS